MKFIQSKQKLKIINIYNKSTNINSQAIFSISNAIVQCKYLNLQYNISFMNQKIQNFLIIKTKKTYTLMKNASMNFFREFDLFSSPASLRIHANPYMKSCMLGILSLMVFSGLIYILAANCLSVINYQQISYQMSETFISESEAQGQIKMFAVSLAFQEIERFSKRFDFHLSYYAEGKLKQRVKLEICRPEQWKDLGGNYQETFNVYTMQLMYCPNNTESYKIRQSSIENNFSSISITLKLCDELQRSDCNLTGIIEFLSQYRYHTVWLYLLDPVLHPEQETALEYRISIVKAVMSLYNREYTEILLSMYKMETDTSLLPWENKKVQTGSIYSSVINNQYENYQSKTIKTDIFVKMNIQMNNKVKNVRRTIGKFDQVIAYVGGLFVVIMPALTWLLLSYNKYRYELKVAEGAFNFDEDGNKIKEKDFHFGTYIQYTIYSWLNRIFCDKVKWKKCVQIDKVRDSITAQMDTRILFRRLHKTEQTIRSQIDKNQEDCIVLMEPLSLQGIKHERMRLDYYDQVIKGEAAVTLEDLLLQQQRKSQQQRKQQTEQNKETQQIESATNLNKMPNLESDKQIDFNLIIPLIHGYHLVKETVDFVKTKEKAQKIVLTPEFEEIENHLAKVYSQFNEFDRHIIENRVPIVILHRLNKKIKQKEEKSMVMGLIKIEQEQQKQQK